jgi:sugar phosphate isomerase/epimerase
MLKLSVSELSTYRWGFEEDVLHYRQAGFSAIGIWRAKLAEYGDEKGLELLAEQQMRVSSLQWLGGFTGSDGRSFRDSMHDAFDGLELAGQLKAESVVVLAGGRSGHIQKHAMRLLRTALRELSEAAQAVGVKLAIEPMHSGCAHDFTFITELPQTLDLIAEMGLPNLGLVFDCYHLAQDPRVLAWLPDIIPYIHLVQLGDSKHAPMGEQNRCLLGQGNLPLPQIVQLLTKHLYDGYLEIELLGEELESIDYNTVLESSKAWVDACT